MSREETNSITHLVKIVAGEVMEQHKAHTHARIDAMYQRIKKLEGSERGHIESNFFKIQSSLQNAGEYWSKNEDDLLVKEVKIALAQIAQNHGRSIGAITARIQQEDLI